MPLNSQRRNRLPLILPEGMIASRNWLMANQLGRHAIDNLVKSGQLTALVKGVYSRQTTKLTWQGVVCSLQTMFHLDVVAGGLTALELQGFGHYVPMESKVQVHLYASQPLPVWLNGFLAEVTFVNHTNTELLGTTEKSATDHNALGLYTTKHTWREGMQPLILSSPERAILEVLAGVPKYTSFEHADQLMQGMTSLSPRRLQELLEKCNNIKVRRLFLWLAERQNYPWLQKLDIDKIHLGSGNRMLLKGGKLNKKYKITVPEIYE
jgi:hypothetical protein